MLIAIVLMYTFRKHHHSIRKKWVAIEVKLLGIKLETHGKLDPTCDMFMMNHQSLLDIVIIEHIHSRNLAWVGKKEITDLPIFGHIMKAPEMISINREDKTGIVTLLKEAKNRLNNNRPIAMFPEGTRSDGSKPIVLINTRKVLDSKTLKVTPGVVKIIYLDPIVANKKSDWFEQAEHDMRQLFIKHRD
jgi:1-acyl-sn-glycerol-3-phosphate acyltransferase